MPTIGLEWVNKYHGRTRELENNGDNVAGFKKALGAIVYFECRNDQAWDQDFESSDAPRPRGDDRSFADSADLTYFSGHGSVDGPYFGIATHHNGEAPPDRMKLGDLCCKWVVFDACQVLQQADWLNRLQGVFDGLHYMLGFDTVCRDVDDRGQLFAQRLKNRETIREAWARACVESDDDDNRYAYVRAVGAVGDSSNDHWIGMGEVSPDPRPMIDFEYISSAC